MRVALCVAAAAALHSPSRSFSASSFRRRQRRQRLAAAPTAPPIDEVVTVDKQEVFAADAVLYKGPLTLGEEPAAKVTKDVEVTPGFSECLAFAIPALGIYIAGPLMSMIDAAFVGRQSSLALAALGPASTVSDSCLTLLIFISVAVTNMVASAVGGAKKDVDAAAKATTTAMGLSVVLGLVFGTGLWFGAEGIATRYIGAKVVSKGALVPLAASYIKIRALALPAALVGSAAQAACVGAKDTRTPMLSVGLAAVLNLMGDLVLVPRTGIVGAAVATAAAQYAAAAMLAIELARKKFLTLGNMAAKKENLRRLFLERVWPFFRYGPFMFCCAMKLILHNSSAMTAVALGGASAAAHTVIFSVGMFCFVLGDVGTSLALAYLPAYYNDKEGTFDIKAARPTMNSVLRVTWSISSLCVLISSAIILRGANLFTADEAVAATIRKVLPWTAGTLALHGTAVTLEGLLLIQRDLGFLCCLYGVIGASALAFHRQILKHSLGLNYVWANYVAFQLVRTIAFAWRGGLVSPLATLKRMTNRQNDIPIVAATVS